MTTIAARDGVIASDGCMSCLNATFTSGPKLWRSKRTRSCFGFSGTSAPAQLFREWYEGGANRKERPDLLCGTPSTDEFTFLEIREDGSYWLWFDDLVPVLLPDVEFVAVGSGTHYALGAMAAGASARQAVNIAIGYDPYSSKPIRWIKTP